ncbi:MAG: glycosyltransferase family 9 protein [Candidatus Coatesbacteria bacterium]|nr:glycosyltransferase family 9 protein [Candidatus Coatesbacteria bacterium]
MNLKTNLSESEIEYKIINPGKLKKVRLTDNLFYRFLKEAPPLSEYKRTPEKILLLRLAYIGDVLMCLPLLKPIREKFPQARIDFVTSNASKEVLEGRTHFDNILSFDVPWFYKNGRWKDYFKVLKKVRKEKYDLLVDLRGDIRNILFFLLLSNSKTRVSFRIGGGAWALDYKLPIKAITHKVDFHSALLTQLNANQPDTSINIRYRNEEIEEARSFLEKLDLTNNDKLVFIHPGARLPLKTWQKEKFERLTDALLVDNHKIVGVGLGSDSMQISHVNFLNLAGKTSLPQLGALLSLGDLFIGNDSAAMHLATFSGTKKVLGIFGPSKPYETSPYKDTGHFICLDAMCRKTCDESLCNSPDYNYCMKKLDIDEVIAKAFLLLDSINC